MASDPVTGRGVTSRRAVLQSAAAVAAVSVVFLPRGLLGWLLRLPPPARLER